MGDEASVVPFTIWLAGGEHHTLEIRFKARAAYFNRDEVINRIQAQVYFLSPAAFFEGQTQTVLEVEHPSAFALDSSIPLDSVSETLQRGTYENLPAETWVLSYAKKSGLPFGTNRRGINNLIAGGASLLLLVLLLSLYKRRKTAWLLLIPLGLSVMLYRPSYGTMFMIVIFGPMILVAIIFLLLGRWLYIRNRKKKGSE